jgi:hypothetical protein
VCGCLAKVNILITKKRKIGPKIIDYIFVGYYLNNTTYRFLFSNPKIVNNTIIESCDVILFGNIFPMKNKLSKLVYDSSSSKIEIVDDTVCNNFRKSNER